MPLYEERPGTTADREKFQLLLEGHAVYGQRIWFLDAYPLCVKRTLPYTLPDPATVYFQGFQRVRKLVKQSGPQILMEIPRRWRSL